MTSFSITKRSLWTVSVATVASLFFLAACEKKAPPAPASKPVEQLEIVRLGVAAPLTGGQAHLGKDVENGVRLAIEQANAKGLSVGGKKVRLELLSEDDEADPKKGPVVAQKLVDAKVMGVVAHLNSGVSIPASAIYSQAGIAQISGASTNPQYTEQGYATTFRTLGRDDQLGSSIANYLINVLKVKRVALVDDATAYGKGVTDMVEKSLKEHKVKFLPREQGTDKTVDWRAVLTKVKSLKPDAVFYGGMDDTGGPLLKQARELGIKAVFAFGDGSCTTNMITLAGPAAEGMVCSQAGIPVKSSSKAFLDAYKARFNIEPITYAPYTYDAARILIQAMERANSAEPQKVLAEVKKTDYNGATGHIQFDDKGDRKDAEITIHTVKEGVLTPIFVVKGGQSMPYKDFEATLAAPATPAPATPAAPAPVPAPVGGVTTTDKATK